MKKEELEQLNDLHKEIAELESAITRLQQQKSGTAVDKVRASGKYFPYVNGYKTVEGFNMAAEERRIQMLDRKEIMLRDRKKKAEEAEIKIMEYINSVQDSRIRRIMQYRYIEGYKWEKISRIMNCHRSTLEKAVYKYLDKN